MNNTNPITNNAEINYPPYTKRQHSFFSGSIKEIDLVWLRKGWEPLTLRKKEVHPNMRNSDSNMKNCEE